MIQLTCDICKNEIDKISTLVSASRLLLCSDEFTEKYQHICVSCLYELQEIFAKIIDGLAEAKQASE